MRYPGHVSATSYTHGRIQFADLCVPVELDDGREPLAIFGEVEGNHGKRLLTETFWMAKSPFALFGIGLFRDEMETTAITAFRGDGQDRVIVSMSSKKGILADFHKAIYAFEALMVNGPLNTRERLDRIGEPGLRDVVNIVIENWARPVVELLKTLQRLLETQNDVLIYSERKVNLLGPDPIKAILTTPSLPKGLF